MPPKAAVPKQDTAQEREPRVVRAPILAVKQPQRNPITGAETLVAKPLRRGDIAYVTPVEALRFDSALGAPGQTIEDLEAERAERQRAYRQARSNVGRLP
jgi:hypothetical protein